MYRIKFFMVLILSLIGSGICLNAFDRSQDKENSDLYELKIYFLEELDKTTSYCLGCHDGVIATDTNMTPGYHDQGIGKSIGLSHPVDIDYEQVYTKKMKTYHYPGSLDPRLKLENRKITCLTCHDENSTLKNHLVMENTRSRLCFSCHNL